MKIRTLLFVSMISILLFNCQEKNMNKMKLSSDAFTNEALIPSEYSCEGEDSSPFLKWDNAPSGTKCFALTCVDPDAPMGDWIHWITWNIPADWKSLPKNISPDDQSQFTQGINSWGRTGYGGPCPPVGHGPHRYYFTLYALDKELSLDSLAQIDDLLQAIKDHIIEKAEIMGKYERK